MSGARSSRDASRKVNDTVLAKPFARVRRILINPRTLVAEPEAVTPGVHVGERPLAPHARQLLREQHLQITYRGLFQIVAACVAVEPGAPLGRHADVVTRLVQDGMHGRVVTCVEALALQARLGIAPVRAGYHLPGDDQSELQAVTLEQHAERRAISGI